MYLKNMIVISILSLFIVNSCGDENKSEPKENTFLIDRGAEVISDTLTEAVIGEPSEVELIKGYLVDSPIGGVSYRCDDITGVTLPNGQFACEEAPVTFSIGEYALGEIDDFTEDAKVYPQDLLDLDRDEFDDEDLTKLVQLLQSLDSDQNSSNGITISKEVREKFADVDEDMSVEELLEVVGENIPVVDEEEAINHLKEEIEGVINENGGDVDLEEFDIDDYSVIYVYKNTTAQVIEELKRVNQGNNDFRFSDEVVSCSDLGYTDLSTIFNLIESSVDIPENDFEIDVDVKVYVSASFLNISSFSDYCTEVDYANSKNAGTQSATIYWNE